MKDSQDYRGQTLFVGIDVHKKTYSVVVVHDQRVVKRSRLRATAKALIDYLDKFFPGAKIKSAYEAGFSGFGLHRELLNHGIDNIVVHAAHIEVSARDRVKTDKRDAQKIAEQLAAGRLRGIQVPTPEQEDQRSLTRLREDLVRERTRAGLKMKSHLMRLGVLGPDDDQRVCKTWVGWVESLQLMECMQVVMRMLIESWHLLDQQIRMVADQMKLQAEQDAQREAVYRSSPGIGPVVARTLANELGDMLQFSNERHLFSFSGFTSCEYSSGENRRQGHISRQGRPVIRKMMVQVAWRAIGVDMALREEYQHLARRVGGKRAIVAIARRLLGHIRACFKTKTLYRIRQQVAAKESRQGL